MPTYECVCSACNHRFKQLVFKGDEDLIICPECKGREIDGLKNLTFVKSSSGFSACTPGTTGDYS